MEISLPKSSGIYAIKTLTGSKLYVGSSKSLLSRAQNHLSELKRDKHVNPILQHHVNKYGIDDIYFELLELCEESQLIIEEQKYIDLLKPNLNSKQVARGGSPVGEGSKSTLTNEIVSEIKHMLEGGISCQIIANMANVSRECIQDIKKGRTWKHIVSPGDFKIGF